MSREQRLFSTESDLPVEEIPKNITFEELIEQVGGKAAGLLWVKKHLPQIPQPRMIVATPGNNVEVIARAAIEAKFQPPWIIRGSTPVDNLPGFEDAFPTKVYDDLPRINNEMSDMVRIVQQTNNLGGQIGMQFDSEASVIIAEKSESNFTGTLVAHPNMEGMQLAGVADSSTMDLPKGFYFVNNGQALHRNDLSKFFDPGRGRQLQEQVAQVGEWYKAITALPGFNSQMTYQLEFGLSPLLFFQVRDFLPIRQPAFQLEEETIDPRRKNLQPVVFGITPPEGIVATVFNFSDYLLNRPEMEHFHTVLTELPEELRNSGPIATICYPPETRYLRARSNIMFFAHPLGLLSHDDIRAMRQSELTVIQLLNEEEYQTGDKIHILSDGVRVQIRKLD